MQVTGLVCEHSTLQGDFGVISGGQDWSEVVGKNWHVTPCVGLT